MPIDFSKYAVGDYTPSKGSGSSVGGSQISGSQIDFSRYAVPDYTGSQSSQQQQVTQIYQPPQEDNRNIFQKARDKAQGFFQDFGYNQQQGTDIVTRGKQVVKKVGDWAFGSDQEVVQLQKQDLQEKLVSKKSEGKNTKEEESQLQMIYKIEDPKTDASTRKQLQQYIRLARFGQSIQSSIGTFFSTLLGISQQQEETIAGSQAELYSKLYNKTDDSKPIKQYYKEEKEYWEGVRDGTTQTRAKDSIDIINKWVDDVDVAYPTNAEKVANAGGSMLVFATASVASGGSAQVPLIMEAMGEAGAVYTELRDKGKGIKESSNRANTNFVANIIIGQFLNIFDDLGVDKGIKSIVKGIGTEGGQEGSQQILSNLATDRPIGEGVLESAIIGGILGGSAVLVFPTVSQNTGVEANPDTFIDELIATDYAKTAEGKQLMKIALQAKDQGRSLLLNITEDGKTEVTIGEARQVQTTEVTGQAEEEAPRREKISVTDKYDGAKSAYAVIRPDGTGAISVILDKSAQGKGLGSEIVADLESQLAQKGVTKVELSAFGESVGFWQKQGYKLAESKGGLNQPMTKTLEKQVVSLGKPETEVAKTYLEEKVDEKEVFRGSKGEVIAQPLSFERVLVVPRDQYELMVKLAEAGNKDAKAHIDSLPRGVRRVDYTISDRIIREAFQSQYDAIQYNNKQLKAKGKEWHDLKNNKFFAEKKETAQLYANTNRGGKYEKDTKGLSRGSQGARGKISATEKRTQAQARADKISEYIESKKTTKFREGDIDTIKDLEESAVTSKFLEDPQVKGREFASYSFLDNLSRSNKLGLKPREQEIIKRVLDKHFFNEKRIDMKEFRRLVIGELMPINTIKSSTYADYGSDNINIDADNTTTYILDTPYKHGETGHFSSDFQSIDISKETVEVKEIPAQEGNPRAKWAVVRRGVQLTRENIEDNVLTVSTSKEGAERWIEGHTGTGKLALPGKSGLFSHYRSFDVDNIAHVAEVQSDVFQNLDRIDPRKYTELRIKSEKISLEANENYRNSMVLQLERAKKRRDAEVTPTTEADVNKFESAVQRARQDIEDNKDRIERFEKEIESLPEPTKEQAQFLDYKNIWHERTVREAIRTKALEGFEVIRFPTPRTIAFIEGYTSEEGGMPYEILEANDEDQLSPGDTIDYGGEEMTVVEADRYQIKVAPTDKVNSFLDSEFREEDINSRIEDIQYDFEKLEEKWGEINTPEKAQLILDKVDVIDKYAKYNTKDEALRYATDTTQQSEERVAEIKARKKPTASELKGIPEAVLKDSENNQWGYSLGEAEYALEILSGKEEGEYAFEDLEEELREKMYEQYEPDYEGVYTEVYYEAVLYDTRIYAVDGYTEQFQQPDEYEPAVGIEEFDIEAFDQTQQVVLRFYERQLNKYIKKLRKDNLELVEDDRGFEWWESKLTEEDKSATVAFRLKDDLADAGIIVTDQQEQEIIDLNKKIFGDDNIKITSQILANNKALGAYSQKMIEILAKQANPKDTFFHEAVHKYIDVFTTKDEQFSLFEEGVKRYQTEDLALVEEKIAEDFIKYANNARSIKGIIARFFKKIFSRIRAFNKNASKIEKLYEDIISGKAKETVAGQTKASKVAVSIEQNLNERFENLAGFETRTVKSQAEMVGKLISRDIDQVRKIVTGDEPLPAGMSGSMFIAGVEKYATDNNDIDLIRSLAISPLVSETSVNAQELRFLAERDKTSVLARVQELASERAKIFKSKHKNTTPEKAIKQEVKKIKKSTNKVSKYDWNEFINSIEC